MVGKPGFHHTEEIKAKLSALRKGDKNPFFGRTHSTEFKARLSQRTKLMNAKRQYEIQPRSLREISDAEAAYLAGMVDGDGSIGKPTSRKPVCIIVANTSRALMDWLETISPYKAYARKATVHPNAKVQAREVCWIWTIYGARDVAYLLQRIRPYLIVKRQRADQGLAELLVKYGTRLYDA